MVRSSRIILKKVAPAPKAKERRIKSRITARKIATSIRITAKRKGKVRKSIFALGSY